MIVIFCVNVVVGTVMSNTALQGTLWSEVASLQGALSCGVFCHLACTCPSDEGTPPIWRHFLWS